MEQKIVLVDTNLLIAAFDTHGNSSDVAKQQAKQILRALLEDANVKIVITPLIRYEVLRGIQWSAHDRLIKMQQALNQFDEIEVTREISELSADLYRFDKHQSPPEKNLDKRKFDVFHLATAKIYHIDLATEDGGFDGLETLYQAYTRERHNENLLS